MPKVTAATLAVTAILLLGLAGCAAPDGSPAAETTAPETSEPAAPTTSPDPLAAETPDASSTGADSDEGFLDYVRDNLLPETQIPNATDEQLIAAGHEACKQLESGVALEDVRVVEGEAAHETTGYFYDSIAIRDGAIRSYCPDMG